MRNLLLTSVLAVSFLIPGASFAGENIFGVNVPVERQEVNNNVLAGSYVETDSFLANTLVPQKLVSTKRSGQKNRSVESYYVFGVDIKSINKI